MVNETPLEESEHGLVPAGAGWFVANVRDMRWSHTPGMGHGRALTGRDPSTTYHWETEQEDFLVLAGEGIAIVEGEERPVRQWDFVHCPPGTKHAFAYGRFEPSRLTPYVDELLPSG